MKLNITREDLPGRQVALTIDLDMETVNAALDRAYRQMVNQVNIPGFRKGKAPRYLVESYLGKETLTERAVRNILPDTLQQAIKDQDIEALDVGDVEIVSMDPVQVKVVIIQPPKVELGDYGTIRAERDTVEITPEQVDEVLLELRRDGAPWNEPAEPQAIEQGNMVYLDLEGYTTQGPLEEAARENFPTIVGMSRAGVPDVVNEALAGMKPGEEKDVTDTLSEDYPTEDLRGLDVTYHVTVRSLKTQELPDLDDEFAKKLGYDDVAALRAAVESNLRARAEDAAGTKQLDTIIDQLVERSTIEVPDVMVNEELDGMLRNLEERLKQQRITLRQYFTYNGITEADWREGNRERAHDRVVRTQALQEFARREAIAVGDEDVESEVEQILGRFEGEQREQAQQELAGHEVRHEIEDRLFQQRIVERLVAIAEGREQAAPAPTSDTEAEAETAPDEKQGDASDLEEAGGAAELLGTEGVDTRSENETGSAPGGGTPDTAPAASTGKAKKKS